jgi:hypothetical protein
MQFQIFKILSLIQKNLISFYIGFNVNGLFISLSTFNWRHSPKSLSLAETDLVESTTVQQLWACVTTKKLILDHFLNSSKLSIVAAKMSPYTSNASDSHTVLHPLCTWPYTIFPHANKRRRYDTRQPDKRSIFSLAAGAWR